ncbi:MAG: ComEA family DNA-binding protein [Candidatus Poribacteria bacterium]
MTGIGPKLADTILVGRPYRSMKELQKIKGLGPKKLATLKDQIAFE